jgi:hypothetical protein
MQLPTFLWQSVAKVNWAHQMAAGAMNLFDAYVKQSLRIEAQFDGLMHRIEIVAEPIPVEIPLAIATALHNLRSALDTAVSVLMARETGKPDARINFPMHGTERELRSSFGTTERVCAACGDKRISKGAHEKIREHLPDLERLIIEDFKPWKDGTYALWALGKLDNISKHRVIMPVIATVTASDPSITMGDYGRIAGGTFTVSPGTRITLGVGPGKASIKEQGVLSGSLIFPSDIPLGGEPIFEALKQLTKLTAGIIQTLEAHFKGGDTE